MTWTFTLPFVGMSPNETLGHHWSVKHRQNQVIEWQLLSALNRVDPIPPATAKRRLTLTRHGRGRLDADNLASSFKGTIDAIRRRRLILDDNPDAVDLVFQQVVSRKEPPKTTVTLEDL